MVQYTTTIHKFGEQGEKTGWTYIEVPADIAESLNAGVRKSYRVKGFLDQYPIKAIALVPMGGGSFIISLNATIRKGIAKKEGATLKVQLALDTAVYQVNSLLLECLKESEFADKAFRKLPPSHQNYYSKWIESAKTQATQEKRIVRIVTALERGLNYAEMLREQSAQ
ncbi:MAG: YdeI/OmpD-associated family protein [Phycisphaerales bacterium]|nr:YdeI/OmpD-associated family protein [Phycisphaerales bacterium]